MFNLKSKSAANPAQEMHETQLRLLDAAEESIADHGVAGVSLREITTRADVNLGLVKYHFRSKDGLIDAVFARHLEPIGQRRLAMLDAIEQATPRGPLVLEEVLDALIRPVVEEGLGEGRSGRAFLRIMGRLLSEPPSLTLRVLRKHLLPTMRRFDAAFARALPGRGEDELGWRKMAGFGAVQQTLLMLSNLDSLPLPIRLLKGRAPSPELVTRRLVAFIAAGMRAQVSED
jgi:AcrR family transcriptional regulator